MKTFRTTILLLLLAVVAAPIIALSVLWFQVGAAISAEERSGILQSPVADPPLTMVEKTIAIAESGGGWNVRTFPCRPVSDLWAVVTHPDVRAPSVGISTLLAQHIVLKRQWEGYLQWHLMQLFTACQLEQRHSDTQILRAWLKDAYFGVQPFGLENAAHTLFGKDANDLDLWESAQLAALLPAPHMRDDPEKWNARARRISDRVAASPPL